MSKSAGDEKRIEHASDDDDSEAALQAEGARLKDLLKADAERPLGRIPKAKRPKQPLADDP